MSRVNVEGKNAGKVVLYALSTCVWCKKTKALLEELGVAYEYEDVDLLSGPEEEAAINEMKKHNPDCSFPMLVINDRKYIIGFKEDEIRGALKGG